MKIIIYTIQNIVNEVRYISASEEARDKVFDALEHPAEPEPPTYKKYEWIMHIEDVQQKALAKLDPMELYALSIPSKVREKNCAATMRDLLGMVLSENILNTEYNNL